MNLSEQYKKRIKVLAGLISENNQSPLTNTNNGDDPFKGFENRVKFDKDLMVKAIREGWEVGLLFFSKNDKYQARTYKSRIIYPVSMGVSQKGNPIIRAFHKLGQSEAAGLKKKSKGEKNWKSAEASNEWRLFKVSNISRMWLTGNFFNVNDAVDSRNGAKYSTSKDKGMKIVEIQYDKKIADQFQKEFNKKKTEKNQEPVKTIEVGPKPEQAQEKESGTVPTPITKAIAPVKPKSTKQSPETGQNNQQK